MTRTHRLMLLAITLLPVIALVIASVSFLAGQVDFVIAHSNLIVASELEKRFHLKVEVGQVTIRPLGKAVIKNIRIANGDTFQKGTLASAARITVKYDWRALLKGRAAASVSEVDILDPKLLLIRRLDGSFNVTELLKPPPGPEKPPFSGLVKMAGGKVSFIDYAVRPGESPRPIDLRDINAAIEAKSLPVYAFNGSLQGGRDQFAQGKFSGAYNANSKRAVVKVDAADVLASLLTRYAWQSKDVQVLAGKIDINGALDIRHVSGHYKTSISGKGTVRDATAKISLFNEPLTNIGGLVELKTNKVDLDLTARFAGGPIHAIGSLDFANPPTQVDLTINSAAIDANRLIKSAAFLNSLSQFSPSGLCPLRVKLTGTFADPTVVVDTRMPNVVFQDVHLKQVAISATYKNRVVRLQSGGFSARGMAIQVAGDITTKPSTSIDLQGRFSNLNLALLPLGDISRTISRDLRSATPQLSLNGKASGTFTAVGPVSSPTISVSARAANGSVAEVPFGSVESELQVSGTSVKITNITIGGVLDGKLRGSGMVSTTGRMDLSIIGESINIGQLAARFGEPGVEGAAFFNGRVTGTFQSPHAEGYVEAFGVRTQEYSVDHAAADFSADRDRIVVREATIQVFPAAVRLSGEATGLQTNRIFLAAKASMERLEVTKLLELSGRQADLTGIIGGEFTFSGIYHPDARPDQKKLVDAVASGFLNVEDGTAFGYPITSASVGIDYADDLIRLLNASVTGDGAELTANGTVNTATREVDGAFKLTNFALSRLQEAVGEYAVLAGSANASGTVAGEWNDIKTAAQLSVDNLRVNFEKFDRADLQFSYEDGKVASYSAVVERAGQSAEISGAGYDIETNCFNSARGVLENISIPDIIGIVRASPCFSSPDGQTAATLFNRLPKITGGRLNGVFELSGCLDSTAEGAPIIPDGKLDLVVSNIGIDIQQIQDVELHASARDGVISLHQLLAISDDASLEATGERAYENGVLQIEVAAENVQLNRLSPWLGDNAPRGTLSATFDIDGPYQTPDIIGSIEIIKPGFGGFTVDSIRAGQIRVTPNRIEIPDILLSAQGHQAVATASVPWNWLSLSVPNDEPVSVSAQLNQQSLNIIGVLLPLVDAAKTTGMLEAAWFRLDGTLLDPQMAGAMKIADGTVVLDGFTNTFTGVKVDLGFEENRVVVNECQISSSLGGTAYVVPGGSITLGILSGSEIDLDVVADQLVVGEKNILGFKEDVLTQIDAGLLVNGPLTEPVVADNAIAGKQGGINLSNARFSFQTAATRTELPVESVINPRFDITLTIGKDVVIAPPSLRLTVPGSGRLVGSLLQPQVPDLRLTVQSGEINLATARLRLAGGGTINIAYLPPHEPGVSLNLQAEASVFALSSFRRQERYQITMRITGQAANPQISLSSNPPGLNREQMLAALGHVPGLFSSPESDLQNELASVLTAAAASTLFAPIEDIFVQKFGFEQFSLQYSSATPLSLFLSHKLAGKLYLSFYQRLSAALADVQDVEYQVLLNYRWRPNFQVSFGIDDQQTATFQVMYAAAFR